MKKPPPRPNHWPVFTDLLPRRWTRIGHPIPVPGGFVFIVGTPVMGRMLYPIIRYVADGHSLLPVLDDGHPVRYRNSRDARNALPHVAHTIETEEP